MDVLFFNDWGAVVRKDDQYAWQSVFLPVISSCPLKNVSIDEHYISWKEYSR